MPLIGTALFNRGSLDSLRGMGMVEVHHLPQAANKEEMAGGHG